MKRVFLPLIFVFLLACEPAPTPSTTTTSVSSTVVTTTTSSTTTRPVTTTSVPVGNTLFPSGGDDTDAFVAAANAYSTVVVDGPLKIGKPAVLTVSDKTIVFTSRGSLNRLVRAEKVTWQVLVLKNSRNVVINNLQVKGPNIEVCDWIWYPPSTDTAYQEPRLIYAGYNAKYESQHGLEIRGGSNIVVNGGNIYGMSGDGIYLDGHPDGVRINNVSTLCTGRSSISNVGSKNVTVTGGTFHRSGLWIFNIEPYNSNYVHNYTINNSKVGFSNWQWILASGPYFSCDIRNVNIMVDVSGVELNPKPNSSSQNIRGCVASQFTIVKY